MKIKLITSGVAAIIFSLFLSLFVSNAQESNLDNVFNNAVQLRSGDLSLSSNSESENNGQNCSFWILLFDPKTIVKIPVLGNRRISRYCSKDEFAENEILKNWPKKRQEILNNVYCFTYELLPFASDLQWAKKDYDFNKQILPYELPTCFTGGFIEGATLYSEKFIQPKNEWLFECPATNEMYHIHANIKISPEDAKNIINTPKRAQIAFKFVAGERIINHKYGGGDDGLTFLIKIQILGYRLYEHNTNQILVEGTK